MSPSRFTATLEAGRRGGAFVVLPDKVLEALGGGSRFRVTGTLAGVSFASSTMGLGGGRVCMGVHKATRQAAGVEIGDRVKVEVERDDRPREVSVPDDLATALAGDRAAKAAFEKLPFTHRREYVESITGAKRQETRARRIEETLDRLHQ
ncbi:MAG: YdeI/OmpD-associated family protein [Actinomycetota bacterium]|nr:YdeI/OmpD-associated family protein [Actinomycetota bacterium]